MDETINNNNSNNHDESTTSSIASTSPATAVAITAVVAGHQQLLLQQQPSSSSPVLPRKIYSKNSNGTVVMTATPNNDAELQLYRVMQRASLLAYYDTLLEMGGDDVQQLCDAGEEEFLEIMALVGMASKPLHVRRFQKSLQEWMIDPSPFRIPLLTPQNNIPESFNYAQTPTITTTTTNYNQVVCCAKRSILETNRPVYSPSPGITDIVTSPGVSKSSSRSNSPMDVPSCSSSSGSGCNSTSGILVEAHILRLRTAAERISKQLPQFEPKTHNAKRKVCKELENVMTMSEDDPRRMEEIRKYAAIYGRFDCKRKPEKPLTLHEISVNEAAAQICHFVPVLLTRRDELFPLARQVVRDSGYLYSKGMIQWNRRRNEEDDNDDDLDPEEPPRKKTPITPEKTNA